MGIAIAEEGSAKAREAKGSELAPGARLIGKVKDHESYGVFVFLDAGNTGLIPLEETGVDKMGRGDDLRKAFPVGSDVEVIVLEVDPSNRRIRLSAKAVKGSYRKGRGPRLRKATTSREEREFRLAREHTPRRDETPARNS